MDQIEKYIEELMEKSTPDRPIWNIEKIMQGLKSTWNYIDGCMIKAILEMYAITKEDKYLKFADDFIVSSFIWNMRPVFMIKKIMTIFSGNFLMLKKI